MPNQEYDTPTKPNDTAEHNKPEEQAYPLEEILKAQGALRSAAKMPPERFPLPYAIGMFSDEIDVLRQKGRPDNEIAAIISGNSVIQVDADCLQRFYVAPQNRQRA